MTWSRSAPVEVHNKSYNQEPCRLCNLQEPSRLLIYGPALHDNRCILHWSSNGKVHPDCLRINAVSSRTKTTSSRTKTTSSRTKTTNSRLNSIRVGIKAVMLRFNSIRLGANIWLILKTILEFRFRTTMKVMSLEPSSSFTKRPTVLGSLTELLLVCRMQRESLCPGHLLNE